MIRTILGLLLATTVLFSSVGGAIALTETIPARSISITGKLESITTYGTPHYTVDGYILIHTQPQLLASLSGSDVTVSGTEFTGPTIFMQKALRVTSIAALTTPNPLYGTPFHVLFGDLVVDGTNYYITSAGTGQRNWVTSSTISLASYVGKPLGAVAAQEVVEGGQVRFRVLEAVVLSDDLAERIKNGHGLIYIAPVQEISVRLRGRMVVMDQSPVVGNGRTLVGLRSIAEALGAQVSWNDTTKTATVRLGDREVVVHTGSDQVIVRTPGQPDVIMTQDIAAVIVGGRTMVPARVLSEGLGLNVHWNPQSQTVDLY